MAIDWTLIKRSINSRLKDGEQQALEEWLEESPEHRELYRNVQAFLSDAESFRPGEERTRQFKADYEQRLAGVVRRRRMHRFFRIGRVAALFLLPLTVALFLLLRNDNRDVLQVARVETTIQPGSGKAILVTHEGKAVSLDRHTQQVEIVGGVTVKNDANSLIYSDSVVGAENAENQLIVPRGGEYSIRLSDGTRVWLNSASELKYPVHFNDTTRKVYLKGEAYFQVAHNQQKAFIVVTDDIEVKVYGTEFNINTRAEDCVQTTLVNGSVSIRNAAMPEKRLRPDQMAEYNRKTGLLAIADVDVANYIGWKSGVYVFENRTIDQIMEELSLWYDIEVFFMNNAARGQRFSGSLPRYREIGDMLSVIEKTSHVRFELKDRTVMVK